MRWFNIFFHKNLKKTNFVEQYEANFEKKTPSARPLDQLHFVVLDTETTGLQPQKDHILSFGAIKVIGYKIRVESVLEMYLDAPRNNRESVKVHELIAHQKPETKQEFAEKFLAYIGNDILVGHHIGFDLEMLEKVLKPFGLKRLLNPALDTGDLAMRLEKGVHYDLQFGVPGEFSLDNLCRRYHIPLDDRHTASGDAFLTAQLLLKLLKIAEKKGIGDFGSLVR
jgi:DNA polymerase III subunit epsilon